MSDCPVCGRKGVTFTNVKRRQNALCSCGSRERHRATALVLQDEGIHSPEPKDIFHLRQHESALNQFIFKGHPQNRRVATCDLFKMHEKHGPSTLDFIVHNHVMEHIELHRIAFGVQVQTLKPGGKLIFSVPLRSEDGVLLDDTLEIARKLTKAERRKFYTQHDHVRYYGVGDTLRLLRSIGFTAVYAEISETFGADRAVQCATGFGRGAFVATKKL